MKCLNVCFRQTMTQIKIEKENPVKIFAKEKPESFSRPCQRSMMKCFTKIVLSWMFDRFLNTSLTAILKICESS